MSYVKIGVAGPVGSGKTALIEALTRELCPHYSICVVTNDIYTKEDAEFLVKHSAMDKERIIGVETGGCPHTAIREDASMNLEAVEELTKRFPDTQIVFIESGGDNLSATFSPELADATILSSMYQKETRSRARAVPASRGPTCSSSTKKTSHHMSGPTSASWTAIPRRCAARGRSCSRIS